ncbi:hypothetical protein FQN60_012550 [Etheostoma spectabile]|uniref:Uncharacterized protein n=1 Tax=Etheostoma spectabile TaxID=54343 RepID=A0A5J5DPY2_9PERO|nr:hypothetical protein FQN60_012550 [Etheostoma spectabile]
MVSPSMKPTHPHSWKWRMKIRLMCSNSKQEALFFKDCFLWTALPPSSSPNIFYPQSSNVHDQC